MRYPARYFLALEHIASQNPWLKTYAALDSEGLVKAFSVMLIDDGIGWYLHGATETGPQRSNGIADLLIDQMVSDADANECRKFSLMASPWDQSGLSRFKGKWADHNGLCVTHDFASSFAGAAVRQVLRWQSRGDHAAAKGLFSVRSDS